MRVLLLSLLVTLALGAQAQAACYADYKASRENPLELQYGVAEIFGACSVPSAEEELRPRLAADGWQLLEVLTTFDESGLEERRESAGQYFLRY
ncbi:hypothetical protein Rumeso_03728 [Rubellimicrobium mesophilum DSM 19309]|uniref:DUF4177 domain-containing protein n=1 Tax=Rubellimicrobium mesophilum DSM 19309 TaxID=442562 RepID=A0A017HJY8_9RHOB|nr:hypothetical protein [Rubellimicrobium mesophilum]EYD74671.1 hypothetical protein Rumeso_03728 [Rubellimicrobium mesophilum DSM 19309]